MRHRLFVFMVFSTLVGCADNESQVNDRKNNIPGRWSTEIRAQYYLADSLYLTTSSLAELGFDEDGVGTWKPELEILDTLVFSWYYQVSPERILLLYPAIGISPQRADTYDVMMNEPDFQKWHNVERFDDQMNPDTDSIRYTLTLNRL